MEGPCVNLAQTNMNYLFCRPEQQKEQKRQQYDEDEDREWDRTREKGGPLLITWTLALVIRIYLIQDVSFFHHSPTTAAFVPSLTKY